VPLAEVRERLGRLGERVAPFDHRLHRSVSEQASQEAQVVAVQLCHEHDRAAAADDENRIVGDRRPVDLAQPEHIAGNPYFS